MYSTSVEIIFIVSLALSFCIGIYFAYKCHKDIEKYKVKISPENLQKPEDNLPA
tara:strand:- start:423 stop:584 length:162 start_codon:yes stop_codon:yes gene_type:complete